MLVSFHTDGMDKHALKNSQWNLAGKERVKKAMAVFLRHKKSASSELKEADAVTSQVALISGNYHLAMDIHSRDNRGHG